jgi:hypothetical protein
LLFLETELHPEENVLQRDAVARGFLTLARQKKIPFVEDFSAW